MAVLLETSKGDVVVDLFVDDAPKTCLNIVKLFKLKLGLQKISIENSMR